ncbi:DedA family protein [Cellulomonas marina]|uniref:Membrane protein DedA, SNARE-associated domain n=1 Tax=Cellulomonas marina TaxID=988821 RepID=A0A1I0YW27_9CELL|nr:hypothetical protein [Cellulomonas marina]GIG27520.1 hypothetical protein Cma02nite_01200 [Cellulomonas marina]SFB16448.1 membrane protein DedA, SNARE-associated domain [Cellulomonas marina]
MTDAGAAYGLDGLPVAAVLLVLFGGALLRSHAIYWAGRGVAAGAGREQDRQRRDGGRGPAWWRVAVERTARWSTTPLVRRGVALVRRWGVAAVPVAYLTVGIQSAVFAAAGLVRMPYLRFALASLPGAVAWAVVWSTVGLGAWWAAVALAARSPWALPALAAVVLAALLVARRRRTRPPTSASTTTSTAASTTASSAASTAASTTAASTAASIAASTTPSSAASSTASTAASSTASTAASTTHSTSGSAAAPTDVPAERAGRPR